MHKVRVEANEANEALCPGCGRPADRVSGLGGFRFRCARCNWSWGHPQLITLDEAMDARDEARRAAVDSPQSEGEH